MNTFVEPVEYDVCAKCGLSYRSAVGDCGCENAQGNTNFEVLCCGADGGTVSPTPTPGKHRVEQRRFFRLQGTVVEVLP